MIAGYVGNRNELDEAMARLPLPTMSSMQKIMQLLNQRFKAGDWKWRKWKINK